MIVKRKRKFYINDMNSDSRAFIDAREQQGQRTQLVIEKVVSAVLQLASAPFDINRGHSLLKQNG